MVDEHLAYILKYLKLRKPIKVFDYFNIYKMKNILTRKGTNGFFNPTSCDNKESFSNCCLVSKLLFSFDQFTTTSDGIE